MADTDIKPAFDPTQPFQPADDTTNGTGINIRPGGPVPVQAAEKPPFDPTKPFQPANQLTHDFSWGQAITDIPSEIKKEAGEAYQGITNLGKRSEQGPVEGMLNTANAAISVPRLLVSPLTGTINSLGGHSLANLEHAAGSLINPEQATKDNPEEMYEQAKHDTDLAMMAAGPEAGGLNKVPVVPKPPTPPPSVAPVVSAADRISQVAPAPINVPKAFASDSVAVQRAGQLARNVPFVGDSIPRATWEMADQLGNAAGSIANEYGQGSGPNVANRIGTTIHNAAEAETNAATNAARTSDEALLADWQRYQDTTHANITNQENTALAQARVATGDMSPQDMGQALIDRLRTGEQAARAEKDRLYNVAGNTDASVQASAAQGLHDQVSNALYNAGRVVDTQLTPAANSMMNELRNFSRLRIPNRVGPRPPAPRDIVSVSAQNIEQTRKRLGNMAQAATNDADRAASRIIMNQFDNWQTAAYDNALYSGSPDALDAIRDARAANTSWRQRFYNDRDDADRLINRVVTGEVTPQEMSNWLVGTSQIGAKGVSSRLITRLTEATANDPVAMDTIRAGVANRLFGTTPGATARTPEKVASDINEFFNGSGRDVARRLYTPQQRTAALNYADTLRRAQEARQSLTEVARNTKPSAMPVDPGPMQQLATSILGKNGKTDEALFSAIDAYAKSGGRGDIKTLSDIMNNIPAQDKGDLAGAIIRQLGHSTQTKGFALDKFVTEWNKYTPQAKTILFGNAGPHRQALDDIATIAQRYKEVGRRFGNPSGTGQTAIGAGLLSALYFHPFTTIPALVGGAVFARMLAAPASAVKTAGLLKNAWLATKSANPLRLAALNTSLVNFVKEANRFGASVSVPLQNVQGPGTSNAKEPKKAFGGKIKGYATDGSVDDTIPDNTIDPKEQGIAIHPVDPTTDDVINQAKTQLAAQNNASSPQSFNDRFIEPPKSSDLHGTDLINSYLDRENPPPTLLDKAGDVASRFGNYTGQMAKNVANLPQGLYNNPEETGNDISKLTGAYGKDRYQTWPERLVKSGFTAPQDVTTGELPAQTVDPVTGEIHTSPELIQRAQDTAGLAGVGGIGGIAEEGAESALGSGPFFRPALKYNGKIYKAPIGSDEHMDAVPDSIYPELQRKAMSGQDISDYNFGYLNNKGQFMSREGALDYGIKEGLIDPQAGQFGHLSTPVLNQYKLFSDSSEAGAPLSALEKPEPFYSQVEKTIQSAPQQKMQGSQWANWLKNQPGVKPDEMQYTGIEDWLRGQNGPVTKQAVQDYIGSNKVQVGDVVKGDNPELSNNIAPPNYQQYSLPGGENYREHLITLPNKPLEAIKNRVSEINSRLKQTQEGMKEHYGMGDNAFVAPGKTVAQKRLDLFNEQRALLKEKSQLQQQEYNFSNYQSSHWDEPNVIAHARTTDRDVGGTPSLHIEEAQSDWAQAGRKNGYKNGPLNDDERAEFQHLNSLPDKVISPEQKIRLDELYKKLMANSNGVPDMPFKQTDQWAGLVMKRMIQKAIDEGKTRVSWTPGEAQPTNPKNLGQTGEQAEKADKGNQKFYNEILPNVVQKLGKKYGVQVKDEKTDFVRSGNGPNGWVDGVKPQPVKYFDIPPKMREDVTKNGFQLFSDTSKSAPLAALEKSTPDDFWTWPKSRRDSWLADNAKDQPLEPEPEPVKSATKQSPWQSQKLALQKRPSRLNKDGSIASDEFKLNDPTGKSVGWLEVIPYEGGKKLYVDNVGSFESKGFGPNAFGPSTTRDMLRQLKQHYPQAEQVGGFRVTGAREKAGSEKEAWVKFEDGGSVFAHVHAYKHKDNIGRIVQESDAEPEVKPPHRAHGGRVLASNINHHPSEAQKRSGAYAKDRIHIHGLRITIENAKGSARTGVSSNGKSWSSILPSHYGYINRTEGADQDHLDMYLGPHIKSEKVYVINQVDHNTKSWDEHKIMCGFGSLQQALNTYEKAFSDGKGLLRVGSIVSTTIPEFKMWLKNGNTKKPYVELRKEVA